MPTSTFFTSQQRALLDASRIPFHVAIIPDGNRRWAKQHLKFLEGGYRRGADIMIDTVLAAKEIGIKVLTFYLFSTENWNRPLDEVAIIMRLIKEFLISQCARMVVEGICVKVIGDLSRFPRDVVEVIQRTLAATRHCSRIEMVMALNYGGRDEICRAVQRLIEDHKTRQVQVTEQLFSSYLDTASWRDPDLLIRTSGEMRLSNFLPWQLSYAEFYVTHVLWPDFTPQQFLESIIDFQKRKRRLGGV